MLKSAKAFFLAALLLFSSFPMGWTETSLDSERLDLEMRMQSRIEEALGKILPAGLFVVVIRVEPLAKSETESETAKSEEGFYLPGVPVRQKFDTTGEKIDNLVETLKPNPKMFQRFVRRVQVTLVIDDSISDALVTQVRELTRQMISLDPARGDTLDVQRTSFNKPSVSSNPTGINRLERDLRSYWGLILLVLVIVCIAVFFLFMFGPLRGFLNNFVQILPTLKPAEEGGSRGVRYMGPEMLPPYGGGPQYGLPGPGGSPAAFSGSLQVENPNKTVLPFGFIREDHLGNLAILLSRETPEKAAVVLGYLPPEWISQVLSRFELNMQAEVSSHLATTRQLLPEQVEDIEQDLKRRLDYLIGGPERIFSIYESLEPEAQRRMLDNLKETRPEIAEELRSRTLLFEDLERLDAGALKSLLREVELQTIVMSLRGVSDGFRTKILEHMTPGKAEIIKEELDLSDNSVGKATLDAQRKMVMIAKRLEREGQINIPQVETIVPNTRYPSSLRSTLKLPPGMKQDAGDNQAPAPAAETPKQPQDIQEKIRKFMNRRDK